MLRVLAALLAAAPAFAGPTPQAESKPTAPQSASHTPAPLPPPAGEGAKPADAGEGEGKGPAQATPQPEHKPTAAPHPNILQYRDDNLDPSSKFLAERMQAEGFRLEFDAALKTARELDAASEGHPTALMLELSVRYLEIEELSLAKGALKGAEFAMVKKRFDQASDEFRKAAARLVKVGEEQQAAFPSTPWPKTYLGAAWGGRGLVEMLNGNLFAAYRQGKRGAAYMQEAVDTPPGVVDALYGLGQYKYYSGTYGPVLSFLLFLDADIEGGLKMMEDCAARGSYTGMGSSIFLAKVLTLEQKQFERALPHAMRFFAAYPHNHRAGRYLLEAAKGLGLATPKGREAADAVLALDAKGWRAPVYAPYPLEEVRGLLAKAR